MHNSQQTDSEKLLFPFNSIPIGFFDYLFDTIVIRYKQIIIPLSNNMWTLKELNKKVIKEHNILI